MCFGFKKVESDDPQSPDSLCNTFTEAGGGDRAPPPLPLIIPGYLGCLLTDRSAQSRTCLAAASHWPCTGPTVTYEVCGFAPSLESAPGDAPSLAGMEGLAPQPTASQHQTPQEEKKFYTYPYACYK